MRVLKRNIIAVSKQVSKQIETEIRIILFLGSFFYSYMNNTSKTDSYMNNTSKTEGPKPAAIKLSHSIASFPGISFFAIASF